MKRKYDVPGIIRGATNKALNLNEEEAIRRANICASCEFMKLEQNPFFKVKDKIREVSEMMCSDECGCSIPFKIRDPKSTCKKWQ